MATDERQTASITIIVPHPIDVVNLIIASVWYVLVGAYTSTALKIAFVSFSVTMLLLALAIAVPAFAPIILVAVAGQTFMAAGMIGAIIVFQICR